MSKISFDAFYTAVHAVYRKRQSVDEFQELVLSGRRVTLSTHEEGDRGKTRDCFRQAVKEAFGSNVFHRLENAGYLLSDDEPVTVREVRAVAAFGSQVHAGDVSPGLFRWLFWRITHPSSEFYLQDCTPSQAVEMAQDRSSYPPLLPPAPAQGFRSLVGHNPVEEAEWAHDLTSDAYTLTSADHRIGQDHPWLCRLVMAVINTFSKEEQSLTNDRLLIPAPSSYGARKMEYYYVYKTIAKGGLCLFVLLPVSSTSKLDPILTFRCTEQKIKEKDLLDSLGNDVDQNIGESGWEASKDEIADLMESSALAGKKVRIAGYSLGGGHAAYCFEKYFSRVKDFVVFNGVGSPLHIVKSIAEQVNVLPRWVIPPPITFYRNKADWVNQAGDGHVGEKIEHPNAQIKVFEATYPNETLPSQNREDMKDLLQWFTWLTHHGRRCLDPKESRCELKVWTGPLAFKEAFRLRGLERVRREIGEVVSVILNSLQKTLKFIFRICGIEFFHGI